MDSPSVNWKFLESFPSNTRPDATDPQLLDLGSCGLHVVHGSFQTGHKAAGWTVNELLRIAYGLFKDSPARRADYKALTGSECFTKKVSKFGGWPMQMLLREQPKYFHMLKSIWNRRRSCRTICSCQKNKNGMLKNRVNN